uniref:Uncharacterized protein n=1 Tax=Colobus angolensis palliatus TaxID=336983 RepID=A0A2K5K0S0_COLAP
MGQDRVAVWPSPESSSPSPEGKRESGIALRPECPPAALWACALGVGLCPCKGLATWPFWSRHFVPPIPTPQSQPSISPSHCGPGLGEPRHSPPPPWYTGPPSTPARASAS